VSENEEKELRSMRKRLEAVSSKEDKASPNQEEAA
jgi:hypothetical protein